MRLAHLPVGHILPPAWLLCACLLLAGCCQPACGNWLEYKIFCGMSRDGGAVSEAEWQRFCDEYVSAEFPDGYTALEATGYWKSEEAPATMREDSRILVILAPSGAGEKVRRIAQQYRRLFQQESVLVTTSPSDAVFFDANFDEKWP